MLRFPMLLLLAAACTAHRSGDVVRAVRFTVPDRPTLRAPWAPTSNRSLRGAMVQRDSSWLSLVVPGAVEPTYLERSALPKDEQRLEVWLAEHGYFDATFGAWEVERHGKGRREIKPVTVRATLDAGPRSLLRELTLNGIEDLGPRLRRGLRSTTALAPGRPFDLEETKAGIAAVRARLAEVGFAFATVTGEVHAFPEEGAIDVVVTVTPGVRSRYGPVELVGVQDVPRIIVEDTVTFEEGERFHASDLSETRTALFARRVFSVVDVVPVLDDPASGVVPVRIEVQNTKARRLQLGPGVELETGMGTLYGTASWQDHNLDHRLWSFQQTVKVGVAGVVAQDTLYETFDPTQVTFGPVGDAKTTLAVPHVLGPTWSFEVDGHVEVGMAPGYRFLSPELAPGLVWRPEEQLTIHVGYRLKYFDYFGFTVALEDIVDSPLGLDLTDPYVLSMLDQRITWDGRNDPVAPRRGAYAQLALAEAGGPAFGNFDFVRATGEVRGYLSAPRLGRVRPKLVLAARVGSGIIAPVGSGPDASVPFAERLYLGGGTSVRGWGADRLGPSVAAANNSAGVTIVPAGGLFQAFGNLELRKVVGWDVSVVGFTDAGRVWDTPSQASFDGLQWSVGGGLRYATAIGPIRGDLGVRLGDEFPDQPRWALHFGLSEAF